MKGDQPFLTWSKTNNHERYAEEVKQGLQGKRGAAKKAASKNKATGKPAKEGATLFDMEGDS